ncbi:transcription elongation factor [Glaciecola sp. SC05]|uniref:transcription elongation factor n=1 Tax=Glaciecola sp. SC05 TaxID=1987355 RepID=UPI003528EFBE
MMSYKRQLIEHLVRALETNYQTALSAAKQAHSTATDRANIAENKYDTLGLEAAYLAEGHANRALECKADLQTAKNLHAIDYSPDDTIRLGALVRLIDQDEKFLSLFLAPVSGGVTFVFDEQTIVVITQSSPLGKKLIGKYVEDEFEIGNGAHKKNYCIIGVA